MKKNKEDAIRIIPLGGVEEIGINCTAFEYRDEIIVIDCGMGFPENDQYGVDFLIPNTDYLERNKKKIKAVIITHSHYDHIGGLDLILPKVNFPNVYAPPFAKELITSRLTESKIIGKIKLSLYKEKDILNIGNFKIGFFKVNHSTPDSFGIAIKTNVGTIVHTGDFKFDNSPLFEQPANYIRIAKLGAKGVLALLSDSTNSYKKGFSKSESEISDILRNVVKDAKGRIIVATFSQLVDRINQLLLIGQETGKKVSINGRSLATTIRIARKLKYIKTVDNLILPIQKVKRLDKSLQMHFVTGHQGEDMAALSRISRGEHKDIQIQKGDTVILSSSVIPGNEILVQNMIDLLSKKGATIIHQGTLDLHAGGHGYQEDQKLMINLTKPKFFIPVHGYHSFLSEHSRTAVSLGIPEKNTHISRNGEEIILTKNSIKRGKRYRSKPIFVSGLGVGDIGNLLLSEREQLANYGIVIIHINVDTKTHKLLSKPQIITKGFIFEKGNAKLINIIREKVIDIPKKITNNNQELKRNIEKEVMKITKKQIQREPMIVTIIN